MEPEDVAAALRQMGQDTLADWVLITSDWDEDPSELDHRNHG